MKSIFKSKTVLLGLLISLIPFLQTIQTLPLTPVQAQVVSGVLGVLVIINRLYTTTSISINKPNGDM